MIKHDKSLLRTEGKNCCSETIQWVFTNHCVHFQPIWETFFCLFVLPESSNIHWINDIHCPISVYTRAWKWKINLTLDEIQFFSEMFCTMFQTKTSCLACRCKTTARISGDAGFLKLFGCSHFHLSENNKFFSVHLHVYPSEIGICASKHTSGRSVSFKSCVTPLSLNDGLDFS